MESNDFSMLGRKDRVPKVGDIGLFRFFFEHKNVNESVAVMCRLVHVLPNGVGIRANFSELTKKEHEILEKILESNSDKKLET